MSLILKLNLENIEEEANKVANNIFENIIQFSLEISKDKKSITIFRYDSSKTSNIVQKLTLRQIHKQYDFNNERFYGFYEIDKVESLKGFNSMDTILKYNFIASSFNRTNKA